MVERVQQLRIEVKWSYRDLVDRAAYSYASYMRWKSRVIQGEPALQKRGPAPALPLALEQLQCALGQLHHGPRRTADTGELYNQYRGRVARRQFRAHVRDFRRAANRRHRENETRIEWRAPGLVWSMDQTESGNDLLHQVQDLASRYKFEPLVADAIGGEAVAAYMENLFRTYGAPLVLKFDNGSNLNCAAVLAVLERWGVIPLPSPPHYPPYNGGIERGTREIKEKLTLRSRSGRPGEAGLTTHELNHEPRPCLGCRTSCAVFETRHEQMKAYTARKRREVFDWITAEYEVILATMQVHGRENPAAAWRRAVEIWLHRAGAIAVSVSSECHPLLPEKWSRK